ncbi:melanoma antigen recognized by T-cells 1 isoform C [Alligator mississippiensis]|uniref:Melanoma antigen recognized by T-cells 1 isoform C n=1 Tax=Alligator mississippiensis TaxID=8496 RepID=A0A151M8L7_ALLMI|nr:melanoma antigen recognized by T-cells 1 isoform C [Alligator mississippiensis]
MHSPSAPQQRSRARCDPDQSYKMPRGAGQPDGIFSRGKGYSYLDVEEAVGIGILVVVLAVLLIIGCWYYWKRSGYKSLWAGTVPACRELGGSRRRAVRQGAPCACTRTRPRQPGEQLPQNKSSGVITLRTSASGHALLDSKGPLQQYSNFNSVVPDAPPAYDKISAEPLIHINVTRTQDQKELIQTIKSSPAFTGYHLSKRVSKNIHSSLSCMPQSN